MFDREMLMVSKIRFSRSGWSTLKRLASAQRGQLFTSDVISLPRLLVPPLRQTLARYLRHIKLIVNAEQFREAKLLALEFGKPGGEGEELQKILEQRVKTEKNWLSDWWAETYLDHRTRLPIDYSPGLSFPLCQFSSLEEQLSYAARLCASVLQYKALIDKNQLPVDMMGSKPMDMVQYGWLFGTSRLPKKPRDVLRFGIDNQIVAKHIIVARNGHLFAVDMLDEAGEALNSRTILSQLNQVVEESGTKNENQVGLLTSWDRDSWADTYVHLKELGSNHSKVEQIETAHFVLCLDEAVPVPDSRMNEQHRQLLHGGGSAKNSGNRWFDKTLQFCVGRDGLCGLNYEHTPAEAPPVARLMDYVAEHIDQDTLVGTTQPVSGTVRKLDFELDAAVKSDIKTAGEEFDKVLEDVDLRIFVWDQFGQNLLKSHKISPDSICQLAYQLTHFKMRGFNPPSYETGSLRIFNQGRTDNIRLPTEETAQFVSAMLDPSCSIKERARYLRDAAASHKECTAAACSGNGLDRHLLGLLIAAQKTGRAVPKLLQHSAYQRLMHFNVATSQVPSVHDIMTVFGPGDPDTYGICYNPQDNKIIFSVMTWKSCAATDGERFVATLGESLGEMYRVLADSIQSKL